MSTNFAQRAKKIVSEYSGDKKAMLAALDALRREQAQYEQSINTDRELDRGIEVEHEHKPTLDFVKKYYKENGKFPTINKVAKSIAIDHIKDAKKNPNMVDETYYKGLIDRGLSDEVSQYALGGFMHPMNMPDKILEANRMMNYGGSVVQDSTLDNYRVVDGRQQNRFYPTGGPLGADRQFGSEKVVDLINNTAVVPSQTAMADTLAARYHRAANPLRKQLLAKDPRFESVLKGFESNPKFKNSEIENLLDSVQRSGYGSFPMIPTTPEYVKAAEDYNKFISQYGTKMPIVGKKEIEFNEGKLGYFGPRSASFKALTPSGQSPYGFAFGGQQNISQMETWNINQFAKGGGIHIKPENRGKFTATKKATGKTTEELTHSKNPLTRKRAIFAQNARKWHHADGGLLDRQQLLRPLYPGIPDGDVSRYSNQLWKSNPSNAARLEYQVPPQGENYDFFKRAIGGGLMIPVQAGAGGIAGRVLSPSGRSFYGGGDIYCGEPPLSGKMIDEYNLATISGQHLKNYGGYVGEPSLSQYCDVPPMYGEMATIEGQHLKSTGGSLGEPNMSQYNYPMLELPIIAGQHLMSKGGNQDGGEEDPLSIRNNNPGNLTEGVDAFGRPIFRKFNTAEEGLGALSRDIALKFSGKSPAYNAKYKGLPITPERFVNVWSPPNAYGNTVEGANNYAKHIAKTLGIGPYDAIQNTPENQALVAKAVSQFESGNYDKGTHETKVPAPPIPSSAIGIQPMSPVTSKVSTGTYNPVSKIWTPSGKDESIMPIADLKSRTFESNQLGPKESKWDTYMRYAPVAFNAIAGLTSRAQKPLPSTVSLPTMSPTLVSARQLSTAPVLENVSRLTRGEIDSLAGATGGSAAAMRAGLQGLSLSGARAASDAINEINAKNLGFATEADRINAASTDAATRTNLAQRTRAAELARENIIANQQDRAMAALARRKGLSDAATALGQIGKENVLKRNIEDMFGYDADTLKKIVRDYKLRNA